MPPDEAFGFSFIDADKQGYPDYWEEVLKRTRPGGLIMLDNTLKRRQGARSRAAAPTR